MSKGRSNATLVYLPALAGMQEYKNDKKQERKGAKLMITEQKASKIHNK